MEENKMVQNRDAKGIVIERLMSIGDKKRRELIKQYKIDDEMPEVLKSRHAIFVGTWFNRTVKAVEKGCTEEELKNLIEHLVVVTNAGKYNLGSYNEGCINKGGYNKGNYNVGSYNQGSNNRGSFNIGDYNHGNNNHGYCNVGDANVGCFNIGNGHVGCWFNKPVPENIKPCRVWDYAVWRYPFDLFLPLTYIYEIELIRRDKNSKNLPIHEHACICHREGILDDNEIREIKRLPNFDPVIFKEITGIEIK